MAGQRNRLAWGIAATLLVVASLTLALIQLGSPTERRLRRLDDLRIERLKGVAVAVESFHEKTGRLPDSFDDLSSASWVYAQTTDPESRVPFGYTRIDAVRYRLCAQFARPTPETAASRDSEFWTHPQGAHCFELAVKHSAESPA